MRVECLPLATPCRPQPGSVDPLGILAGAEQLAPDVLFVGMTPRMWRARHLTFAAIAAWVAKQATKRSGGQSRQNSRRQNGNAATESTTSSNTGHVPPPQAADASAAAGPARRAVPVRPATAGSQKSSLDPPAVQSVDGLRECLSFAFSCSLQRPDCFLMPHAVVAPPAVSLWRIPVRRLIYCWYSPSGGRILLARCCSTSSASKRGRIARGTRKTPFKEWS